MIVAKAGEANSAATLLFDSQFQLKKLESMIRRISPVVEGKRYSRFLMMKLVGDMESLTEAQLEIGSDATKLGCMKGQKRGQKRKHRHGLC